jgi:ABC-2 type transport system permease protein
MSWQTIAKKDIKDSIRSRGLWAIIGIFLALILIISWLLSPGGDGDGTLLASAGLSFFLGILLFVPLAGLFISIKSIVREKETGSINILLSLPHTRLDMLVGKFVGRSVVLTVAVIAAFGPASVYLLVVAGAGGAYELFALLVSILLFGLMFVGVGVGLSALVNSETQAAIYGVVIFFFMYLWVPILGQLGVDAPDFVVRFWLFAMFIDFFLVLLSLNNPDVPDASFVAYDEIEIENFETIAFPSQEFFMQHWFVFVILAAWILVPLAIGYARFKRQDI